MNNEETIQIPPEQIAGYVFKRSPESHLKFNVFAVAEDGEFLYCVANDLDFEKATTLVDHANSQHYPVIPTPTETVFTEIGGVSKVYNITTK